jgi:photosystem II cytochrome c550
MFKKFVIAVVTVLFFTFGSLVNSASAIEIPQETRTLPLNEAGETVVVSEKDYELGKREFNNVCSQCHVGGVTKTNPNVGLGLETLSFAYPARDNIEGLIDYMINPTTYDGFYEISELHPSLKSADIYPEMRNVSEDDLYNIASYILIQAKTLGKQWGGGKIYR